MGYLSNPLSPGRVPRLRARQVIWERGEQRTVTEKCFLWTLFFPIGRL